MEMRLKAMKILQLLSNDERNCERMLSADCASRVLLKMSYPRSNDEYIQEKLNFLKLLIMLFD